jgi:perosamine synthetase
MITTNDRELAGRIRRAVSLGYADVGACKGKIAKRDIQNPGYFRHVSMGWNYRMPELCAAVGLAQLERIDELIKARIDSANLFLDAARGCEWLVPQYVDKSSVCAYWSFVCKLERDDITWLDFRDRYAELGGDGIYSAWALTYLEPVFQKPDMRERYHPARDYKKGLCPVAEYLQPRLLQFKTNYWDIGEAEAQAGILRSTIESFS